MSRCEKLTLVACLGVLFVSIVHLYRLQSKTSVRSLHVFVQPAIIPQSVIPEYNEENILFASESISKIDSLREGTTSSETFPTSSYGLTPTTTEFNSVVFYNRIPKTGSENMAFIIKQLSKRNKFKQRRFSRNGRGSLSAEQSRRLEKLLCGSKEPIIFDEHIHFLPTAPCDNQVSWITMVRDPVEMYISRYLYARRSEKSGKNAFRALKANGKFDEDLTIEEWKKKDLSTCVLSGDPECALAKGSVSDLPVAYLCGQEPYCMIIGDQRALEQAKRNVEQSFPVVGVLEELNTTLSLLEHELPLFFEGASYLYYNQLKEPHVNRGGSNRRKTKVTEEARRELEVRLATERVALNFVWVLICVG